jgi:hypothetical protein
MVSKSIVSAVPTSYLTSPKSPPITIYYRYQVLLNRLLFSDVIANECELVRPRVVRPCAIRPRAHGQEAHDRRAHGREAIPWHHSLRPLSRLLFRRVYPQQSRRAPRNDMIASWYESINALEQKKDLTNLILPVAEERPHDPFLRLSVQSNTDTTVLSLVHRSRWTMVPTCHVWHPTLV